MTSNKTIVGIWCPVCDEMKLNAGTDVLEQFPVYCGDCTQYLRVADDTHVVVSPGCGLATAQAPC